MTNNSANKTSFKKGHARANGAGRKAGTDNKLTKQCREMIATCFESVGGLDGLVKWAKENRTEFYCRMYTRLIGIELNIKSDHRRRTNQTRNSTTELFVVEILDSCYFIPRWLGGQNHADQDYPVSKPRHRY